MFKNIIVVATLGLSWCSLAMRLPIRRRLALTAAEQKDSNFLRSTYGFSKNQIKFIYESNRTHLDEQGYLLYEEAREQLKAIGLIRFTATEDQKDQKIWHPLPSISSDLWIRIELLDYNKDEKSEYLCCFLLLSKIDYLHQKSKREHAVREQLRALPKPHCLTRQKATKDLTSTPDFDLFKAGFAKKIQDDIKDMLDSIEQIYQIDAKAREEARKKFTGYGSRAEDEFQTMLKLLSGKKMVVMRYHLAVRGKKVWEVRNDLKGVGLIKHVTRSDKRKVYEHDCQVWFRYGSKFWKKELEKLTEKRICELATAPGSPPENICGIAEFIEIAAMRAQNKGPWGPGKADKTSFKVADNREYISAKIGERVPALKTRRYEHITPDLVWDMYNELLY